MFVVYMRTAHIQTVFKVVRFAEKEKDLREAIWHQQVQLSGALESPEKIQEKMRELGLNIENNIEETETSDRSDHPEISINDPEAQPAETSTNSNAIE